MSEIVEKRPRSSSSSSSDANECSSTSRTDILKRKQPQQKDSKCAESAKSDANQELYNRMKQYLISDYQLKANGYPGPCLIQGSCTLPLSKGFNSSSRKKCWRCQKTYIMYSNGEFERKNDKCRHQQGVCEYHVHRDNLDDRSGYLEKLPQSVEGQCPGIYALDCEMCYTAQGLELIRVSVVDFDCKLVYDTLVKPYGKILDYNTKWSGVNEDDMRSITTTLKDVQEEFYKRFSSDTIFVGHSLESDLKALRIIHSSVIDTSLLFPHRRGLPYKRALRNIVRDHLGIYIQQNFGNAGHDSTEDANACVELMKWRLGRDTGSNA